MRWTIYCLPSSWPVEKDCLDKLNERLQRGVDLELIDLWRREDLEQLFIFWFRRNYLPSNIIHDPLDIAQTFLLWRGFGFL